MATTEGERTQVSGEPTFELHEEGATGQEERASVIIRDPFWFMSLVVAGATAASLWGIGAVVLAIFGLSGVLATYLAPVAGIVAGVAFFTLGAVGGAWGRMFRFSERETPRDRIVVSTSVAAVLFAGMAAIALSILNLVFIADARFVAIAVMVLGAGLLWHSGLMRRVSCFTHYVTYHGVEGRRPSGPIAINALSLAPLRDFLLGLGSAILGILAILGLAPVALVLVALLVLGGALTLTVSTICGATLATLKNVCSKS
jgi:hypothetical protein